MQKNVSGQKVGAQMISATDGSAFTGSVTVAVTVDAGTQATGSVGSGACTHEGGGYHTYAPAQAETNGDLIAFTFSGTGAVPQTVQVYTRAATPDVNVTQFGGSNGTFSGGRPEVNTSHAAGTAWNSGAIGASTLASDTITAAKIAADAITAAKIADGAIDAGAFAADAITAAKLAADVTTELQNGLATASALSTVEGKIDTLDTNVDTLLTRITSTLFTGITSLAEWLGLMAGKQTGNSTARTEIRATGAGSGTYDETADSQEAIRDNMGTAQTGDTYARLGAPAGASIAADIAAIEAQTDDIGIAGAGLTAVPWNSAWDAEIQSEVQDAIEANHLDHLLAATYDPASKPGAADALLNELVENDGGVARYTANALEQGPGGGSAPTAADIADAVWEEALADHSGTTGSTAEALNAAGAAGDPWTTALPGAYGAGSAGKIIGDNINATISSRASQTSVDTIDDFLDTEIAAIKAKTDNLPASPAATGDIPSAATVASQVRTELTTELGRVDAAISTRATPAQVNTEADTALADVGLTTTITGRIDAAISTRLASSSTGSGFTAIPWNAAWDAEVQSEVQDALDTTLADSVAADGSRPSAAQALYAIYQFLTERSVSGTTLTVRKPDGSTALMTFSLNDAVSPTSITRNG